MFQSGMVRARADFYLTSRLHRFLFPHVIKHHLDSNVRYTLRCLPVVNSNKPRVVFHFLSRQGKREI